VYALINHNIHHIFLSAGFNIPTGSIDVKGKADGMMYPNTRFPYMMQMGSGSYDFMPGITYLLKEDKFSFSTQVTSVLCPFYNSLDYHYGNEATVDVWAAYKWLPCVSTSLRVQGNTIGMIQGKDISLTENAEPAAFATNYGGQYVTAFGGINIYFTKTWFRNTKLSIEYGIPLYQNVNGIQLAQKSTLYAGWLVTF